MLIAVCQELGIRSVLTTEVIPWAHGSVREIDIARRLMHHAVTHNTIPKGVDDRLVTVKDPAVLDLHGGRAARAAGAHHRSRTSASSPTRKRLPFSTTSASCAARTSRRSSTSSTWTSRRTPSTLGKELARASLAVTLGKTYRQEGALSWGYLTPPDDARSRARHAHAEITNPP